MEPLHIVIVNYRTAHLVIECLRSLESEVKNHGKTTVTVVENASGDDSAQKIAEAIAANSGWSSWANLSISPVNGGFSSGNNFAARPALGASNPPAYVWLLNPDTVVHPGTLKALVDFMEANPKVGICGGALDDEDRLPWPYAFKFPSLLSEVERAFQFGVVTSLLSRWVVSRRMGEQPERIDWICGANMMVRRAVFDAVGLMDESYFLYFEETDYCLQAQRAGLQCWYVPQARIIHISGQSTGLTGKSAGVKRVPGYWFDSRRRYFIKNHGLTYARLTDAAWLVAFILGRARLWLQRKPANDPPHYLADFIAHSSLRTTAIDGGRSAPK